MVSKRFLTIFILCLVQGCLSKPAAESDLTEGRGIGWTLWNWLTYPFYWWYSEPELPPTNNQTIALTSKYNVTSWCNSQTCTTQRCDTFGCRNNTCNIYDTDMMGECREYNTIAIPAEHVPEPTRPLPQPSLQDKVTEATHDSATVASVSTQNDVPKEEHPLELEAVLSSTVNKNATVVPDDIHYQDHIIPEQKV